MMVVVPTAPFGCGDRLTKAGGNKSTHSSLPPTWIHMHMSVVRIPLGPKTIDLAFGQATYMNYDEHLRLTTNWNQKYIWPLSVATVFFIRKLSLEEGCQLQIGLAIYTWFIQYCKLCNNR